MSAAEETELAEFDVNLGYRYLGNDIYDNDTVPINYRVKARDHEDAIAVWISEAPTGWRSWFSKPRRREDVQRVTRVVLHQPVFS